MRLKVRHQLPWGPAVVAATDPRRTSCCCCGAGAMGRRWVRTVWWGWDPVRLFHARCRWGTPLSRGMLCQEWRPWLGLLPLKRQRMAGRRKRDAMPAAASAPESWTLRVWTLGLGTCCPCGFGPPEAARRLQRHRLRDSAAGPSIYSEHLPCRLRGHLRCLRCPRTRPNVQTRRRAPPLLHSDRSC